MSEVETVVMPPAPEWKVKSEKWKVVDGASRVREGLRRLPRSFQERMD
jgi:hypothetical protein